MGKSKTGGAFGFITKSIGSVTYSTLKEKNGKRVQILRAKPTDVANPNTVAQILQRMKVKPAGRFYKAFEGILNNAFEGVRYGSESRREFMKLAMSMTGPYIPKGATRFIPAKYPVSRGTVAAIGGVQYAEVESISSPLYETKAFMFDLNGQGFDNGSDITNLSAYINQLYGRDVQLTFLAVTVDDNGYYTPSFGRALSAEMAFDDTTNDWIFNFGGCSVTSKKGDNANMIEFYGGAYTSNMSQANKKALAAKVVAAAVIVSYKDGEGWLRSQSDMVVNDALELNLYGADAQELAVESYQDASSVNNLNSTWYLNLANGQQYPGNLSLITETFEFTVTEEGEPTTVRQALTYPYGSLINEQGQIRRQIFADASGNMIFNVNGTYTTVQNPEEAEGVKIKWSDISIQSQLYGNNDVITWKETYQLQIDA